MAGGDLPEWVLKGIVGGIVGILVTLGFQQVENLRARQNLARLLLVEAEQNAATFASFSTMSSTTDLDSLELADDRRRYEETLAEQGAFSLETVRLLYETYSASEAAINYYYQARKFRHQLAESARCMGTIGEPRPEGCPASGPERPAVAEPNGAPRNESGQLDFEAMQARADRLQEFFLTRCAGCLRPRKSIGLAWSITFADMPMAHSG
jgi:hypothetical protein